MHFNKEQFFRLTHQIWEEDYAIENHEYMHIIISKFYEQYLILRGNSIFFNMQISFICNIEKKFESRCLFEISRNILSLVSINCKYIRQKIEEMLF